MTNKEIYKLFNKEVLNKKYSELNEQEFLLWCDFADKYRD